MVAIGGSVQSIILNGREFPLAADADINRKLGGFENSVEPNGNDTARIIKTKVAAALTGIVAECDDARGDHEFLQAIADGNDYVATAITYASGVTYQGVATIVGELQSSSQNATASFDMAGQGVFSRQ